MNANDNHPLTNDTYQEVGPEYALIDVSPIVKNGNEVNHVQTSFSAMRVLGVYQTEEEAWQASSDCWDSSGRQEFRVVPIDRRKNHQY